MSQSSIESFKTFVKNHPKLIKEVREGNKTWKELYEEWYFLGEEDEKWKVYENKEERSSANKSKKEQPEMVNKLLAMLKTLDYNEVQRHINQVSGAIDDIQQLLHQFRPKNPQPPHAYHHIHQPFHFHRD